MSARHVRLVLQKELREIARDLRALVLLVAVPAVLYPLLMIGAGRFAEQGIRSLDERLLVVRAVPPLPVEVEGALAALEQARVIGPDEVLGDKQEPDAIVRMAPPASPVLDGVVLVEVNGSSEAGLSARRRLVGAIEAAREEAARARIAALLPDVPLKPGAVLVVDTAPPQQRGGFLLGRMLAPILLMMLVLGAFYPAIDASAGERERQTLRTLLCAPVHPMSIALGKLFAVALIGMLAALANLAGFALTLAAGLGSAGALGALSVDALSLDAGALCALAVVLVPFGVYTAAALLAVASFAKNSREAQTLLTPVLLLWILPAVGAALPGLEASWPLALVPVLGPALVLREIFAGTWTAPLLLAAAAGSLGLVVVTLGLAARAFTVEALLTGRVQRPVRRPGPLEPFDAVLLLLAVAAGFVYLTGLTARLPAAFAVLLPQLLLFVGLPLAFVLVRSHTPMRALGLSRPASGSALAWTGALLCVPSLGALAEKASRALFTLDEDTMRALEPLARQLEGLPLPALFLLFAVTPALAEELCFRGAVLGAFSRRPLLGVMLSSVAFSALHGALIRALPTLLIGLLAGLVRLRARSVFPAMSVHLAHNGLALALGVAASQRAGVVMSGEVGVYAALPGGAYALGVLGVCLLGWEFARARSG